MVFAECGACRGQIRVWDMSRGAAPSERAANARDAAITDVDRRWTCPRCGFFQNLPGDGVYVVYDRRRRQVVYVGRSIDVQRRLDWWQQPENRYGDRSRFRGVQLVTSGPLPSNRWFGAGE
jgi:hypothetical protein